jgi:predicted alpha/beta hydrolase
MERGSALEIILTLHVVVSILVTVTLKQHMHHSALNMGNNIIGQLNKDWKNYQDYLIISTLTT